MPNGKGTIPFKVGNDVYNIPEDKVEGFMKAKPLAVKMAEHPFGYTPQPTDEQQFLQEFGSPVDMFIQGAQKFTDNPVAGSVDIGNALLNLPAPLLSTADYYIKKLYGGKGASDIVHSLMSVPGFISQFGEQKFDQLLSKFGITPEQSNAAMALAFGTTPDKVQEMAKSMSSLNQTLATYTAADVVKNSPALAASAVGATARAITNEATAPKVEAKALKPREKAGVSYEIFQRPLQNMIDRDISATLKGGKKAQSIIDKLQGYRDEAIKSGGNEGLTIDGKAVVRSLNREINEIQGIIKGKAGPSTDPLETAHLKALTENRDWFQAQVAKVPDGRLPVDIADAMRHNYEDNVKNWVNTQSETFKTSLFKSMTDKLLNSIEEQLPGIKGLGRNIRDMIELHDEIYRRLRASDKADLIPYGTIVRSTITGMVTDRPSVGVMEAAAEMTLKNPTVLHKIAMAIDRARKMGLYKGPTIDPSIMAKVIAEGAAKGGTGLTGPIVPPGGTPPDRGASFEDLYNKSLDTHQGKLKGPVPAPSGQQQLPPAGGGVENPNEGANAPLQKQGLNFRDDIYKGRVGFSEPLAEGAPERSTEYKDLANRGFPTLQLSGNLHPSTITNVQNALDFIYKRYPNISKLVNGVKVLPSARGMTMYYDFKHNNIIVGQQYLSDHPTKVLSDLMHEFTHSLEKNRNLKRFANLYNMTVDFANNADEYERILADKLGKPKEQPNPIYGKQPVEASPVQASKTIINRLQGELEGTRNAPPNTVSPLKTEINRVIAPQDRERYFNVMTPPERTWEENKPAPAFHLKSEEVVKSLPQNIKVQSLKNQLTKMGVSNSEMDWTRIDEFLKDKKPTDVVTQQDISDWVKKNAIGIEPKILQKNTPEGTPNISTMQPRYSTYNPFQTGTNPKEILLTVQNLPEPEGVKTETTTRVVKIGDKNYDWGALNATQVNKTYGMRNRPFTGEGFVIPYNEAQNRITKHQYNVTQYLARNRGVQWEDLSVLPYRNSAGSNTQKLLFSGKLPSGQSIQYYINPGTLSGPGARYIYVEGHPGVTLGNFLTNEGVTLPDYERNIPGQRTRTITQTKQIAGPPKDFTGGHYGGTAKNIGVHIRTWDLKSNPIEERTNHGLVYNENPEKVLGVGEIQSDWNKLLRKQEKSQARAAGSPDIIPDFPFKGTAYVDLALKYVLRHAAENGYDKIVFASPDQVKDLYNLSQHVDHIDYAPTDDGRFRLDISVKYRPGIIKVLKPEELSDFVGKDIAQKIINREGKPVSPHSISPQLDNIRLDNVDLKMGGEWADKLYGKDIPDRLNKLGKQYGVKVETNQLEPKVKQVEHSTGFLGHRAYSFEEIKQGKQISFTLTPDMKQDILRKGFELGFGVFLLNATQGQDDGTKK